ncbi:hypothetical protein TeGR_g11259 [Tetraparma gracilis]|uniref:Protein kinase domain-containing protein n=1 Tax=Tetraparma gracilis TaxID=2962635 RepID=A0ABQ6N6R6_9STRA|nr:hypothetical protein TeGR_g11259 [Tetraparma gracilis]
MHLLPPVRVPLLLSCALLPSLLGPPALSETFYESPAAPAPRAPAPSLPPAAPPKSLLKRLLSLARSLLRLLRISLTASPLLLLAPLSLSLPSPRLHDATWWYATQALQSLGPAFVKLAQWAASRRDLFPPQACDRLAVLHSRARAHAFERTREALERELGEKAGDLELTEASPLLGAGAVAQVYRCGRRGGGPDVAVKVKHPGVGEQIELDLGLMQMGAALVDGLPLLGLEWFALPEAVKEFEAIMRNQVDLTREAENLRRFRRNFGYSDKVAFPEPMEATTDVLVETYQPGVLVSEYFDAPPEIRKALAKPLLTAFLKMVFTDNFIHCDLHPGNILVSLTPSGSYKLSLIDAGIATELRGEDTRNLRDLFLAVVTNEGEAAGRMIVERAKRHDCRDVDAFARGIGDIVQEFHDGRSKGLTLGAVRIGSLLGRVLELCRAHRVLLEPAMANVVLSTVVLEGVGRTLDPDMNLIDAALPFLLGRGG